LQYVEGGIGSREVHESARIDIAVTGLNDPRPAGSRIHHASGIEWHVESHLAWAEWIGNVVGPYAGIVAGGKDQAGTLKGTRPIFMQVMWPEVAALAAIVCLSAAEG
jgi:hypothetical protein